MKPSFRKIAAVLAYVLGALSIAAGVPKLLQMPQELAFLSSIGLQGISVSVLGLVQLAGGLLLVAKRTRAIGAGAAALVFGISSVALLLGGDTTIGLISLVPAFASIGVAYLTRKPLDTAQGMP